MTPFNWKLPVLVNLQIRSLFGEISRRLCKRYRIESNNRRLLRIPKLWWEHSIKKHSLEIWRCKELTSLSRECKTNSKGRHKADQSLGVGRSYVSSSSLHHLLIQLLRLLTTILQKATMNTSTRKSPNMTPSTLLFKTQWRWLKTIIDTQAMEMKFSNRWCQRWINWSIRQK